MDFKSRTQGTVIIYELSGRFDAHTLPQVSEPLTKIDTTPTQLVLNLSGVSFIDSSACAILVQSMKRCREHQGDLRLCHLQQPVRIIFELTRLDKAFVIYETEAEAIRSFNV